MTSRMPKLTIALVKSYMKNGRHQMWLTDKDVSILQCEFRLSKESDKSYLPKMKSPKYLYTIEYK